MQELCCFRKGETSVQEFDLEQRIVICWKFTLVRFGILSSMLAPSDEPPRPLSQIRVFFRCCGRLRLGCRHYLIVIKYYRKKWNFFRLKRTYVYTLLSFGPGVFLK